jgi:prolipoprotein diacylglyceryltransferase
MPDVQLGYLAWDWLTMGQVLCLPMIVGGVFLMTRHRWVKQAVSASLN